MSAAAFTPAVTARCIGCGCTSERACHSGCFWLRVDYRVGLGVCSNCQQHEARWDSGDRTLASMTPEFDREPESLLLPGDIRIDDSWSPFPELDDYEVALDLLP